MRKTIEFGKAQGKTLTIWNFQANSIEFRDFQSKKNVLTAIMRENHQTIGTFLGKSVEFSNLIAKNHRL